MKRLFEVADDAVLERQRQVVLRRRGAQERHGNARRLRILADQLRHTVAVEPRHHQVRQNQMWQLTLHGFERAKWIVDSDDGEALFL